MKIRRNENSSLNRFLPRFSFHPESNGRINAAAFAIVIKTARTRSRDHGQPARNL